MQGKKIIYLDNITMRPHIPFIQYTINIHKISQARRTYFKAFTPPPSPTLVCSGHLELFYELTVLQK